MEQIRKDEYRPAVHFTPHYGWMNDPNGLVYHDGIYELYYQHNPKGVDWNSMTWGHARGTDLLHWENLGDVLEPDENGLMFSGCAIRNEHGCLGLPLDTLIYFYTAAGHCSKESAGKPYTVRLAYSKDGGNTLIKKDCLLGNGQVIETLAHENRDPKVFWHEETEAYILVLWIEENDFGIWRSKDLEHFTMTQRVTLVGGYECPDLFRIPVSNIEKEFRWVFWSANGVYYVGSFDGYEFRQEQDRCCAYIKGPDIVLPYAAQTWSGTEKVLSISWLRTKCIDYATTGAMSIPKELSLFRKGNVDILQQKFPAAVSEVFKQGKNGIVSGACYQKLVIKTKYPLLGDSENIGMHEETIEWSIFLLSETKTLLTIECQKTTKKLFFTRGVVTDFCDAGCELADLEFVYDHGILEMLGNQGTFYLAVDFPELRNRDIDEIEVSGNLKKM